MTYDQILLGEFDKNYKGGTILFPDVTRCPHVFIGVYQKLIAQGLTDSEIGELVTLVYPDMFVYRYMLKKIQVKYNIDLSGFNNKYSEFLKEEFDMKFDFIICNPPYDGKSQLHQQFFNRSFEILVEGGTQLFIQPATPVENKKVWAWREHERQMIQIMSTNETKVSIHTYKVFGNNADGQTYIMISALRKIAKDNADYIKGINAAGYNPDVYVSLQSKFLNYEKNLDSITFYSSNIQYIPSDMEGAYIAAIRGDRDRGNNGTGERMPGFFTIVGKDTSNEREYDPKTGKGQCVQIPREHFDNFYAYAKSFVARAGLSMLKYNTHNEVGELKTVPLPDFSVNRTPQEWDEFMRKELNITDEEWKEIRRVLPDYHNLGEY